MAANPAEFDVAALPRATASEMQKSWRDVLLLTLRRGRVAVTHHGAPEVVVVSVEEYERMHAAEHELALLKSGASPSPVATLTERFKQRMAARDAQAFDGKLEAAAGARTRVAGRLRPGQGY